MASSCARNARYCAMMIPCMLFDLAESLKRSNSRMTVVRRSIEAAYTASLSAAVNRRRGLLRQR
jgi:hypothetical protein